MQSSLIEYKTEGTCAVRKWIPEGRAYLQARNDSSRDVDCAHRREGSKRTRLTISVFHLPTEYQAVKWQTGLDYLRERWPSLFVEAK